MIFGCFFCSLWAAFGCGSLDQPYFLEYFNLFIISVLNILYKGHVENLPEMSQGRSSHGCGAYYNGGTLVIIVANGWDRIDGGVSSTEKLHIGATAWITVSPLPSSHAGLHGVASVSMENKIYLSGGYSVGSESNGVRNEIFEYDEDEEGWKEVGQLQSWAFHHAMTAIKMDNKVIEYCI